MPKNKKGGRKGSNKSERNVAEDSIADIIPNKGTNDMAASSGVTLRTAESSGNSQASATTSPNMAEKNREKNSVNSRKVTFGAMETDVGVSKNKAENTTGKASDNLASVSQEVAFSAEKSKKSVRGRGKSAPSTSRTQTFATAGRELNPPNIDKYQKLIEDRISVIESGANEPKEIRHMPKYTIEVNPTQVKMRSRLTVQSTLNTGDENVLYSPKVSPKLLLFPEEGKTRDLIKAAKQGMTISGYTPKTAISARNARESAYRLQNLVEQKREGNDNVKSTSAIHVEKQKDMQEEPKNKNENTTGEERGNLPSLSQEVALSAQKPKRKKKKSRRKSAPSSSGIESLTSAEYEGHNFDCLDLFFDKDVDMRKSLNAQVSAIESVKTEPKSNEYMQKCQIESSSQEGNRQVTFNIGDENLENSSKENQVTISDNDSKTDYSIRPVIFLTDKFTQTDHLQEPLESTVMAEATESDLNLPEESNLSSVDQNLQSFKEEFLRDMKIACDNFGEGLIKCLKKEK